jgi:hypothetical protein
MVFIRKAAEALVLQEHLVLLEVLLEELEELQQQQLEYQDYQQTHLYHKVVQVEIVEFPMVLEAAAEAVLVV